MKNKKEKKEKQRRLLILLLVLLLLLGVLGGLLCGCVGRKDLNKVWAGNAVNTVSNIIITMDNGTVVGTWASVPQNRQTNVQGVFHGQYATITWTDANGAQTETVGPVDCVGNVHTVTNIINFESLKPMHPHTYFFCVFC